MSEGKNEREGALEALVDRLLPGVHTYEFVLGKDVPGKAHGRGSKWLKKARLAVRMARKRGFQALILVVDEDGDRRRVRELASAEEALRHQLPSAFGVAIRTFDAWMLADERALTEALGCSVQRQPDPESLRDPKAVCSSLIDAAPIDEGLSGAYFRIAQLVDLEMLERRSGRGFAPFANRVRRLIR